MTRPLIIHTDTALIELGQEDASGYREVVTGRQEDLERLRETKEMIQVPGGDGAITAYVTKVELRPDGYVRIGLKRLTNEDNR